MMNYLNCKCITNFIRTTVNYFKMLILYSGVQVKISRWELKYYKMVTFPFEIYFEASIGYLRFSYRLSPVTSFPLTPYNVNKSSFESILYNSDIVVVNTCNHNTNLRECITCTPQPSVNKAALK